MSGFTVAERELLARIASVFGTLDPVPEPVRRASEEAALVLRPTRTWRRLELVRDNVMSARERWLGFGPGGLQVRVRREGSRLIDLRGSVTGRGSGAAAVWVRWPDGAERALVDASGRFDLAEVPAGPVCLAVTGKAASVALTPWFVC